MAGSHRRHDISDNVWGLLETHLPDREGARGVTACDNRNFLNAFFGFSEQVLRCEICPLTMGTGKILTAVFVDGEIVDCGKNYSKSSYLTPILNGL